MNYDKLHELSENLRNRAIDALEDLCIEHRGDNNPNAQRIHFNVVATCITGESVTITKILETAVGVGAGPQMHFRPDNFDTPSIIEIIRRIEIATKDKEVPVGIKDAIKAAIEALGYDPDYPEGLDAIQKAKADLESVLSTLSIESLVDPESYTIGYKEGIEAVIGEMGWVRLIEHKENLISLISIAGVPDATSIVFVTNILESLQWVAVNKLGLSQEVVFGTTKENKD